MPCPEYRKCWRAWVRPSSYPHWIWSRDIGTFQWPKNIEKKQPSLRPLASEFQVMPFWLHNAPATFQRMMNEVLHDCQEFCEVYIDDVAVYSSTWEEHLQHLRCVFNCLRRANLTLKLPKCQFGLHQVEYLGYVVGDGKILPNPKKDRSRAPLQAASDENRCQSLPRPNWIRQKVCASVCQHLGPTY